MNRLSCLRSSWLWATVVLAGLSCSPALALKLAFIGDRVWYDANANGLQDDGPGSGIPGVRVILGLHLGGREEVVEFATTTDSTGWYQFSGAPVCECVVRVDPATLPPGLRPTYDIDGVGTPDVASVSLLDPAYVTAEGMTDNQDVDFGYAPAAPGQAPERPFITFTQGGWGTAPRGENPGGFWPRTSRGSTRRA